MKPGYKTVGFYLTALVTAAGALLASGAVREAGLMDQALGVALTTLATAGYASWRDFVKFPDALKPAYKTTEFWLSLAAAVVAGLLASGLVSETSTAGKIVAGAASLLALVGYGVRAKLPPVA